MKYKISETLLEVLKKKQDESTFSFISHNSGVDIATLRRMFKGETVSLHTLSKLAKTYNVDFDKSYEQVNCEEHIIKKERKPKNEFVAEVELISELDKRIRIVSSHLNVSEERFFRTNMAGVCSIDTYRNSIRENKFTTKKFQSITTRIEELETRFNTNKTQSSSF